MELHLTLVFGVFSVVLSPAVSRTSNKRNVRDIDGGSYLLTSVKGLYYKKEDSIYTLANEPLLVYRNFDFHFAKGLAFFQPNVSTIASVALLSNGTTPTTVLNVNTANTSNDEVSDFAVDWVNDRIVYSACGFGRESPHVTCVVASVNLRGGDERILHATTTDSANKRTDLHLAVDPFVGKVFWVSDSYTIFSCNLDGSDCKTVLKFEKRDANFVTELTLDLSIRRIYFIQSIESAQGNYSLNTVAYDGGQLIQGFYNVDKTRGNAERDIRSVDSLEERLLLFSAWCDKTAMKQESFVVQSLHDGIVEEEQMMLTDEKEQQLAGLPILDARFVHPELQPASDPTVAEN